MTSLSGDTSRCVAAVGFVEEGKWAPRNGSSQKLHKCPAAGAVCSQVAGTRLESLELYPGFWRPASTSLDVSKCKEGSGCAGGVSFGLEGEGVCSNATTGPYCAICNEGYKRQGNECSLCDEVSAGGATPLLAAFGVGILLAVLWFLLRLHKKRVISGKDASGTILAIMTETSSDTGRGRIVEKLKIVYAFAQVVSSAFEEYSIQFPPTFSKLASALSVVNLDVFGFLSMGCFFDLSFYGELASTCVAPVVVAGIAMGYARRRTSFKNEARSSIQIFTQIYLVLLFCVYAGVTRKIFTTFKCEHFITAGLDAVGCGAKGYTWRDNKCYRSFLRADLALSCDTATYTGWRVFAVFMALLYPFGVPLLFARLLYYRANDPSLSFIRAAYKDTFYWWELVELARKLLLTLTLVFFFEGSASQILLTLLIAFGFTLALRSYQPYKSNDDDFLAAFAQALLVLTSLASLCLKVEVAATDSWSVTTFDFFLTVLVLSVPMLVAIEVLFAAGFLQSLSSCWALVQNLIFKRSKVDSVVPSTRSEMPCTEPKSHVW